MTLQTSCADSAAVTTRVVNANLGWRAALAGNWAGYGMLMFLFSALACVTGVQAQPFLLPAGSDTGGPFSVRTTLGTVLTKSTLVTPQADVTALLWLDTLTKGEIGRLRTDLPPSNHKHKLPAGYRVVKTKVLGRLRHDYRMAKEAA